MLYHFFTNYWLEVYDQVNLLVIQEEGVLRGQELENAVSDADFTKAIQIALELRRPHKLFKLFAELCRLAIIYSFCLLFVPFHVFDSRFLQEERG